jgi:hypothetical protein
VHLCKYRGKGRSNEQSRSRRCGIYGVRCCETEMHPAIPASTVSKFKRFGGNPHMTFDLHTQPAASIRTFDYFMTMAVCE